MTITQASAVWELRAASPQASRWEIYAGAMRIGRDHVASTIYTIVFAYVGTALLVLMLLSIYDRSIFDLRSTEQLAEEIVRTLVTSIGLVLAVPVTTALGVLVPHRVGRLRVRYRSLPPTRLRCPRNLEYLDPPIPGDQTRRGRARPGPDAPCR